MPAALAPPSSHARMPRASAALLIAALHAAVLWLIWRIPADVAAQADVFVSLLSFAASPERSPPPVPAALRRHPAVRGPAGAPQDAPLPDLPATVRPSPLLPAPAPPQEPAVPRAHIDWAQEAGQAARAELEQERESARQRDALVARVRPQRAAEPPGARTSLRWDYAATHRLDTSSGLPVWHINDRCAMPLIFPLFFACAIGHIEVHGDLFQDMQQEHDAQLAAPRADDAP